MKLVNPVHFFDARGRSVLSNDHLSAENDRLQAENDKLKRRLKNALLRLKSEFAKDQEDEKAN